MNFDIATLCIWDKVMDDSSDPHEWKSVDRNPRKPPLLPKGNYNSCEDKVALNIMNNHSDPNKMF